MARDEEKGSENSSVSGASESSKKIREEWFVPACGFRKDFCCCPRGKEDTVCLHSHECPFKPKQPLRKCFPICTTEKITPIYTPCLKKIIKEYSINEEEEEDVTMEEQIARSVYFSIEDQLNNEQSVKCKILDENAKRSTGSNEEFVIQPKMYSKVRRICLADEEPPRVTCSCGSPTCKKCRKSNFFFKTEEVDGEEEEVVYDPLCEDVLECACGLHHCIRCRTKKQLQEQLKRRTCTCNLPECIECKWYSICEVCAAPEPSRSKYFNRRKELMEQVEVYPTISEIKEESGKLSQLIFSQCPESLHGNLGLKPPLGGPGDTLWQSPSDLLEGKVIMKPPYSDRCIKALTHEGIMRIGAVIEHKFMNEMELEKQRALKEQRETLEYLADIEKQEAIAKTRQEEKQLCEERVEELNSRWEQTLQTELQGLEERLISEYEKLLGDQKGGIDKLWQIKLDEAVKETTEKLTAVFLEDLRRQEEELRKEFDLELKKVEIKYKIKERMQKEVYEEKFRQLKHELECKNIANIMYVLCMERRKCKAEKEAILIACENKFKNLYNKEKEAKIKELETEIENKQKQLDLREEFLREIIRQYQKFINFALKSSPTQAEFLLSLEQMLLFELTKQIAKQSSKLMERFIPWKEEETDEDEEVEEEEEKNKEMKNKLTEKDYHNCYRELEPPETEKDQSRELPHFYFNDKLYVREDFRNLLSTDKKVDSSFELWNNDVKELIEILKGPAVNPPQNKDNNLTEKDDGFHYEDVENKQKPKLLTKSSVHFAKQTSSAMLKQPPSSSILKKASLKHSVHISPVNYKALKEETEKEKILLGAVNSLEVLRKKISSMPGDFKTTESTEIGGEEEESDESIIVIHEPKVSKPRSPQQSNLSSKEKKKHSTSFAKTKKSREENHGRMIDSSVSTITDSLVLLRASFSKKAQSQGKAIMHITTAKIQQPSPTDSEKNILKETERTGSSKLSLAKDSLEIIRNQSSEVVDGIVSRALKSKKCKLSEDEIIKIDLTDTDNQAIRISHIEVIQVPVQKPSSVGLSMIEPEIIEISSMQSSDSPSLIYELSSKASERDNFFKKPNQAKVVGDEKAKEHLQKSSQFTFARAKSIVKMLDGRSDLLRLFTAGSR